MTIGKREPTRLAYDKYGRYISDKHRKHVLKSEWDRTGKRNLAVDLINIIYRCHRFFYHYSCARKTILPSVESMLSTIASDSR